MARKIETKTQALGTILEVAGALVRSEGIPDPDDSRMTKREQRELIAACKERAAKLADAVKFLREHQPPA